jgi:hypothetical protein
LQVVLQRGALVAEVVFEQTDQRQIARLAGDISQRDVDCQRRAFGAQPGVELPEIFVGRARARQGCGLLGTALRARLLRRGQNAAEQRRSYS